MTPEIVADNFRGDEAESDPVAAVAEGKETEGKLLVGADVGQAVFGFAEDAGPGAVRFDIYFEHLAEFFGEDGGFGGDQLVDREENHLPEAARMDGRSEGPCRIWCA